MGSFVELFLAGFDPSQQPLLRDTMCGCQVSGLAEAFLSAHEMQKQMFCGKISSHWCITLPKTAKGLATIDEQLLIVAGQW